MGEESNPKSKKCIKVRKHSSGSSSPCSSDGKRLYRVDSKWSAISLGPIENLHGPLTDENQSQKSTENEKEIQVIDLETQNGQPTTFLKLFPKLKQEGVNIDNLTRSMSTTDLTKLLIGQKAEFSNMKFSRRLRRNAFDLTPLQEEDESDENVQKEEHKKLLELIARSRLDSADADVSDIDNDDNEEEG